jgi:hypothetical protein
MREMIGYAIFVVINVLALFFPGPMEDFVTELNLPAGYFCDLLGSCL